MNFYLLITEPFTTIFKIFCLIICFLTSGNRSPVSIQTSPQQTARAPVSASPVPVAIHEANPNPSTTSKKPGLKVLIPDRGASGMIHVSMISPLNNF